MILDLMIPICYYDVIDDIISVELWLDWLSWVDNGVLSCKKKVDIFCYKKRKWIIINL